MSQSLTSRNVAKYFPITNGKYEVKPGLFSLQHDFGNKEQDYRIFQLDRNFAVYRQNKVTARNEQLSKYYCTSQFSNQHQQQITQYLIKTLCHEYPDYFQIHPENKYQVFECKLTNEKILLSESCELMNSDILNYSNSIDAILMQVQEDIAIITEDDHISCLHLMAPNFWSASEKIGLNFNAIHKDVAGIENIAKNSKNIIQAMIYKGPYVRFAWGITTDDNLNHHPDFNKTTASFGRRFDSLKPNLYCRVERQTISGLPNIKSALFTIRSYIYNIKEMEKLEIQNIIDAITSMTNEQLEYKGLNTQKSNIINRLISFL